MCYTRVPQFFSVFALLIGVAIAVPHASAQSPPQNLQSLPHALGQVRVSWTDVATDEDGFVLERSDDAVTWQLLAELPPDTTQYIDDIGPLRDAFTYRVASLHAGVPSPWSNTSVAVPVFTDKPYYGWLNVADHATCSIPGVTDPHPIQCAIQALGGRTEVGIDPARGPHVVYLPDGEYAIDQTLFLEGRAGIQFVGQSPGGVVLRWVGQSGTGPDATVTMFHAEGNRDCTWRNLVWDGGCTDPTACFVVAFDQSFCGQPDLGIPYSSECGPQNLGWPESEALGVSDSGSAHFDSTFAHAFVGLRLGRYGAADDSTTFRRCRFSDNFIGMSLEDFNTLNHYVWDSSFESNFVGISNDLAGGWHEYDPGYRPGRCVGQPGEPACYFHNDCDIGFRCEWTRRLGGNFHVRRARFEGNTHTDIWAEPVGEFVIRDNWSSGSGRFFYGAGLNAVVGRFSLIHNEIWGTQNPAIDIRTPGPFLFLDNRVYTDPKAVTAPVVLEALAGYDPAYPESGRIDLLAIGNTYTVRPNWSPYEFKSAYRLRDLDETRIEEAPTVAIPPLPAVQDPLNGRPVYTVTGADSRDAVANAARIQAVIDAATADAEPAIVHFPGGVGRYQIGATLRIPPGSDLILAGDGAFTTLRWAGTPGTPLLEIDAAEVRGLTLRDLQILHAGVVVKNLDQPNARLLASQLQLAQSGAVGLVIQELGRVGVDVVDYKSSYGLTASAESMGMLVKVGSEQFAGPERAGVAVWNGDTVRNGWDFVILNGSAGARVLISGNYMEKSERHLRIVGNAASGSVTLHGSKLAPCVPLDDPTDPVELAAATGIVSVEDLAGNASLVESRMFVIEPNANCASDPEAVKHGARIRVVGDQPAEVDLEALGLTIRRAPDPDDPDNAEADLPEYDFSAASPNAVDYLRLAGNRAIGAALPLPDIRATEDSDPQNPDLVGDDLTSVDRGRLLEAVQLIRTATMPGFFDEPGQAVEHQLNLDNVFIYKSPTVGLLLSAGVPCADAVDCDDALTCTSDVCDASGLPAGVPGQCRSTPLDTLCDDQLFCNGAEVCTTDGCVPGAEPCPGEECDEELDLCVTPCNGDGTCDPGEDCLACPEECFSVEAGICGNGVCEPGVGEDCLSCSGDCNGKQSGAVKRQFCCGDGDGQGAVGCEDERCTASGSACSDGVEASCCGDGSCTGIEAADSCAVDCSVAPPSAVCGDANCDEGESRCTCPVDCGAPGATELDCTNDLDDDCDGPADCDDADCAGDAACQIACDGDALCEPGEDCQSCPQDCAGESGGKPSDRHCCGDGVLEAAEEDGRCDGNP